jgi:hypothetical protein
MDLFSRNNRLNRALPAALIAIALVSFNAVAWQGAATAPKKPAALTSAERKVAAHVKLETIRGRHSQAQFE